MAENTIKFNLMLDSYKDNGIRKFKDTNLPLNGIYEDADGNIWYYKNGKKHNENGAAFVYKNGYTVYYINGKRHRIDGPAAIYSNGYHEWYINDHRVGNETINIWLKENDIPLDYKTWSDSDKMLFAIHWNDYNGNLSA